MDAPVLRTGADPNDPAYQRYVKEHAALVDDLRARTATAARGGGERARQRHLDRGKLLPRDRVESLVDPGSPFLELSPLAATACTTARHPPRASSPVLAAS